MYLIVGMLPSTYLQYRQYLGRTGRIGNRGQYSVILFDKEARNAEGAVYLEQKLESLENSDLVAVSGWMNTPTNLGAAASTH